MPERAGLCVPRVLFTQMYVCVYELYERESKITVFVCYLGLNVDIYGCMPTWVRFGELLESVIFQFVLLGHQMKKRISQILTKLPLPLGNNVPVNS